MAFDISNQQERDDELTAISDTFERYRDSDFGRKLYLIQNSIFGVDIQPIACQIAKLRFFITLAIEQTPDSTKKNFGIKPLPNLETRFIAADTLIGLQKSEAQQLLHEDVIQQLQQQVMTIREKHYLPSNQSQKRSLEVQDEALCKQLEDELKTQRNKWIQIQRREIDEKAALLPNTVEQERWREIEQGKFEERLREFDRGFENVRKIISWKPYDQNATANFFDPEWMFGVKNGFDVVIGNPPYIHLRKAVGRLGRLYELCNFDSFTKMGDIYCLFYEKANQLLKKGSHVCFITSNKWMRAKYGKKLRDYFTQNTQPIQLLDMGPDMFDATTVETNILLLRNASTDVPTAFTATTLESNFDTYTGDIAEYLKDNGVVMELPPRGEPWAILSPADLALKRKIEDVGKPLKDWDINIYLGVLTGCNKAFVIDEAKCEELVAADPKSAEIIKPLLRGRDIKRYHVQWAGLYILATGYDLDIPNDYPAIYNHLETIGEQIESGQIRVRGRGLFNRDNQGESWWNLRACAYYPAFEKKKVVYPSMTKFFPFVYDPNGFYTNDKSYIITGGNYLKYLTGYFNSRIASKWIRENCSELQGGTRELHKVFFENIPIPPVAEANQYLVTQIEDKVDQILDAKDTDQDVNVSELEDEIDQLVYELYDLTPNEVEIVEDNSSIHLNRHNK